MEYIVKVSPAPKPFYCIYSIAHSVNTPTNPMNTNIFYKTYLQRETFQTKIEYEIAVLKFDLEKTF